MRLTFLVPTLVLGVGLPAQVTSYIAPSGYQTTEAPTNNTIPWWSMFASYEQVHDASDLAVVFPNPVAMIKGISFRKDGGSTAVVVARAMDVQVTMGITPVSSVTATATFLSNLGPTPVVVLPYTNVNLPAVVNVSTPNPQGWFFPFPAPFPYVIASGNLCYEIRYKNSTSNGNFACDAGSGTAGVQGALLGTGCIATGQTTAAAVGTRSMSTITGAYSNRLDRGAASAPAVMLLGLTPLVINLPGFCASLQTPPAITFNGTTDATGTWTSALTIPTLSQYPGASLHAQFAFLDAGLPNGLGFSNCAPTSVPGAPLMSVTKIYASASGNTTPGPELATTGTRSQWLCLVTGFEL